MAEGAGAMRSSRDKYGFKSLEVGGKQMVFGVRRKHAQMNCAKYVVRHAHMIHRDFVWRDILGGIEVERVR